VVARRCAWWDLRVRARDEPELQRVVRALQLHEADDPRAVDRAPAAVD